MHIPPSDYSFAFLILTFFPNWVCNQSPDLHYWRNSFSESISFSSNKIGFFFCRINKFARFFFFSIWLIFRCLKVDYLLCLSVWYALSVFPSHSKSRSSWWLWKWWRSVTYPSLPTISNSLKLEHELAKKEVFDSVTIGLSLFSDNY